MDDFCFLLLPLKPYFIIIYLKYVLDYLSWAPNSKYPAVYYLWVSAWILYSDSSTDQIQNHAFIFPSKTGRSSCLPVLVASPPFTNVLKPRIQDNLHVFLFNHPHSIHCHSADLDSKFLRLSFPLSLCHIHLYLGLPGFLPPISSFKETLPIMAFGF